MALTAKQQAFVDEYLIDLNATQAAMRAGYSEKTARSQGQRLLTNADIQHAIEKGQASRSERTQIDADWVLNQAVEAYKINAATAFNEAGNEEMINASAAHKFLELAGKHVGVQAFKEKVEHSGEVKSTAPVLNITLSK